MFYFKNTENKTVGMGTSMPNGDNYIALTKEQYNIELELLQMSILNERRAQLLEEQQTETDTLNLLLIQRELEDINAYFEGKE